MTGLVPSPGPWGALVWVGIIAGAIILVVFTGPLIVFVAGMVLVLAVASMVYYLGVRVDRRLRGSKPKTVVKDGGDGS